jgi:hypothetical protein
MLILPRHTNERADVTPDGVSLANPVGPDLEALPMTEGLR